MPSPDSWSAIDSPRLTLAEVPEETNLLQTGRASPRSPYFHAALSGSTSTFKAAATASTSSLASSSSSRQPLGPRNPSSSLVHSATPSIRSTSESITVVSAGRGTLRNRSGSPSTLKGKDGERSGEKEKVRERERDRRERERERAGRSARSGTNPEQLPPGLRQRNTPHLPHAKDVELAPPTLMYWSRAPVWGRMPDHGMRAHSVTIVDNVAWIFGGCDERGCWNDVFHFNTETMQWSHPEMVGDIPSPCRAHSATLIDRRIIVFGGGQGPDYYNKTYVLDIITRRWTHPTFEDALVPPPRRAHTAVYYKHKLWIFGGGNGNVALNDVWTLDVDHMVWQEVEMHGAKPSPRGYHTANLIGNVMIVIGGSDGKECFSDIWCLNLDTLSWSQAHLDVPYKRLAHCTTQVGSYLFITGGHDGNSYTSDILLLNLVSLNYEPRATAGKSPATRGYHIAFLADSRLFLHGGFNGIEVFEDMHILDLAGAAYLPQVTSFRIDIQ